MIDQLGQYCRTYLFILVHDEIPELHHASVWLLIRKHPQLHATFYGLGCGRRWRLAFLTQYTLAYIDHGLNGNLKISLHSAPYSPVGLQLLC